MKPYLKVGWVIPLYAWMWGIGKCFKDPDPFEYIHFKNLLRKVLDKIVIKIGVNLPFFKKYTEHNKLDVKIL
jgi:hypothetical protein